MTAPPNVDSSGNEIDDEPRVQKPTDPEVEKRQKRIEDLCYSILWRAVYLPPEDVASLDRAMMLLASAEDELTKGWDANVRGQKEDSGKVP